ncbi:MAG TPA: STAS domain-containing protein [Actinomycetota bacterium]|nr:STAS domain-containing protein [Actinomycetota bacterium]
MDLEQPASPLREVINQSREAFDVETRMERGWAVFDVQGDVDVYSAPMLRHEILARIERGESRIIVNLEKVEFLDSTGVSVMINGLKRARNENGTLVLARPGDQVRRLLNLTHLDRVLPVFPTVEEAVSLGEPA